MIILTRFKLLKTHLGLADVLAQGLQGGVGELDKDDLLAGFRRSGMVLALILIVGMVGQGEASLELMITGCFSRQNGHWTIGIGITQSLSRSRFRIALLEFKTASLFHTQFAVALAVVVVFKNKCGAEI